MLILQGRHAALAWTDYSLLSPGYVHHNSLKCDPLSQKGLQSRWEDHEIAGGNVTKGDILFNNNKKYIVLFIYIVGHLLVPYTAHIPF